MTNIPKKVSERVSKALGSYQRILKDAQHRDVNESDTVTIITDMLADLFGYDKYNEITSEQAIRGTFCDLAIRMDDEIKFLIEAKAVGMALKDSHLRQALNYGANQGIPWVVLTNGAQWNIYKLKFEKPIAHELVCFFDILQLSARKKTDQDLLYLLCKEGLAKDVIGLFHEHVKIVNRFTLAALIRTEPVLSVIRRELRRLSPELKISIDEINELLPDVLKRDVLEGDSAADAARRVGRASTKQLRKGHKRQKKPTESQTPAEISTVPEPSQATPET